MISTLILQNLLHSTEYWRKVLPHLKPEYFHHSGESLIFKTFEAYASKYNAPPTMDALTIELDGSIGDDQMMAKSISEALESITQLSGEVQSLEWLADKTEEFCQEQALHNALRRAIKVLDGEEKDIDKKALPRLLDEALGITFDTRVGHDYLEDAMERWEERVRVEARLPFDIAYLNKITKGGLLTKTLTCFMAPSGVGKSIVMCHMAASHLMAGKNVMYVSCEMSEHRLAERIDMNLMDCTDDDLLAMSREEFTKRIEKIRKRSGAGKLYFKEYGTGTVGVASIRALLNDAKRKKGFVPDVLYVDYLNIMISSRIKMGGSVNSYTYVKFIAEELRALAIEFGIPIITATQVNRDGYDNSDIGMTETSESMGLVHTLDLFLAMIQTEELQSLNQILFKQLKNRYRDENRDRKFIVGLDKSKMKLYDVESSAQKGLSKDEPVTPAKKATSRDFSLFS